MHIIGPAGPHHALANTFETPSFWKVFITSSGVMSGWSCANAFHAVGQRRKDSNMGSWRNRLLGNCIHASMISKMR
ncbi:hypothetical protein D3C87_2041500 [compost metagenome]